ncbi:MAG: amino acid ABC transporter substrate-binding protein [Candidatus Tectimicrobiota bacterium]
MPQPRASIRVGMTAALSGRYSLPGRQALLGAQFWVEDVNRHGGLWLQEDGQRLPLHLTAYDDASEAAQCYRLTERLLSHDQVDILLGPYSSGLALRAAEVAHQYEQILWNHGGSSETIYQRGYRWLVGILSPPSTYFHSVLDYVRHTMPDLTRLAIVHSTAGAFPRDVAAGAQHYAQQHGLTDLQVYPYPAASTDFTPLLTHLAGTAPELILSVGRIEDDLRFATQYLQHAIHARAVALIATPLRIFADTLGPAAQHFLGPSQWEPGILRRPTYGPTSAELLPRFLAQHPAGVDYPLAQAYAAGLIIQHCLEHAGTLAPEALRQAAGSLDCTTFYGRYRIDPSSGRQLGHRMPVVQWQHGQKNVLWPPAALL